MGLQISEAERERRALVAKLTGRFFPAVDLPHRLIYEHGVEPRLPLATLPDTGHLPLRSDRAFVILPSRTAVRAGPSR